MIKLLAAAAISIISLIGVAATSDAEGAEARCGMTIRGKVKLTQDLDCTGQRPLSLVGPRAHLDLNGFTLTCAGWYEFSVQLKLRGQGALLRNGELFGCEVALLDRGDHKVRFVQAEAYDGAALVIMSNSNEVVNSGFYSVEGGGAYVESGQFNLIADSGFAGSSRALEISANRTVIVNNSMASDTTTSMVIRGNFNRVFGTYFLDSCLWDDGSENLIGANSGGIDDRCEYDEQP